MLALIHLSIIIIGTSGGNTVQVSGTPGRPTTILRTTSPQFATTTAGGKQIITVHKAGAASQPQIVTLVKTTQGMTVAPVSLTTHCSRYLRLRTRSNSHV